MSECANFTRVCSIILDSGFLFLHSLILADFLNHSVTKNIWLYYRECPHSFLEVDMCLIRVVKASLWNGPRRSGMGQVQKLPFVPALFWTRCCSNSRASSLKTWGHPFCTQDANHFEFVLQGGIKGAFSHFHPSIHSFTKHLPSVLLTSGLMLADIHLGLNPSAQPVHLLSFQIPIIRNQHHALD